MGVAVFTDTQGGQVLVVPQNVHVAKESGSSRAGAVIYFNDSKEGLHVKESIDTVLTELRKHY
ncbi:hypothetical protein [Chromobacterium haemolyticum]|uniref:hypothetical protein n=1 Tax=Chromobacterium haemolyticum TaxID=394935 RepID=UPI0011316C0E|nr:hypothetical protein [Chromobacterium haemolyticum]